MRLLHAFAATALCAACDASSTPSETTLPPAGPDFSGPMDPLPPEHGQQLATLPYTLAPGEEKYFCYTFTSPDEAVGIIDVTNIAGKLVHHVVVSQSIVPEPEGFSECDVLYKPTWVPIWLAAKGSPGLALPDGVAFRVRPKTQYVVQYHLVNPFPAAVTERSGINLAYAEHLDDYEQAGAMVVGSLDLHIPKDAQDFTQTNECLSNAPLNVFAVLPHMHLLGKRLEFFTGPANAVQSAYVIDPWDFDDQPFVPLSMTVAPGDVLRARCTWDNDSGHDVKFGESTYDEMCMFLIYAWPMQGGLATCGL